MKDVIVLAVLLGALAASARAEAPRHAHALALTELVEHMNTHSANSLRVLASGNDARASFSARSFSVAASAADRVTALAASARVSQHVSIVAASTDQRQALAVEFRAPCFTSTAAGPALFAIQPRLVISKQNDGAAHWRAGVLAHVALSQSVTAFADVAAYSYKNTMRAGVNFSLREDVLLTIEARARDSSTRVFAGVEFIF